MAQALFYSSNAVAMTLGAGIASGDTSCTLSSTSGLPASFPFKLLIGWGTGQQEVVHCTALSGFVATISRGQDSTTAQAHSIGAAVVHGVSAREFNDLELHVGSTSGVHGISGSVVGTTDTQTLTNKTFTSLSASGPVQVNGLVGSTGAQLQVTAADSIHAAAALKSGGANSDIIEGFNSSGTQVFTVDFAGNVAAPNLTAAWTAYTPGLFNITQGNGTLVGRYIQIGKTVHFKAQLTFGSTTSITATTAIIGLPVTVKAGSGDYPVSGAAFRNSSSGYWQVGGVCGAGSTNCSLATGAGPLSASVPFAFATGDVISVTGTYEAA